MNTRVNVQRLYLCVKLYILLLSQRLLYSLVEKSASLAIMFRKSRVQPPVHPLISRGLNIFYTSQNSRKSASS